LSADNIARIDAWASHSEHPPHSGSQEPKSRARSLRRSAAPMIGSMSLSLR
jgi:hypothetical protein